MKIALDYDGTFTLDVKFWMNFAERARLNDDLIYIVTSRNREDPVGYAYWFREYKVPIIYCDYEAKKDVCERLGVEIDIWIDNDPHHIVNSFNEDVAEQWRAMREG